MVQGTSLEYQDHLFTTNFPSRRKVPMATEHEERFSKQAAADPKACPAQTIKEIEHEKGIVWGEPLRAPRYEYTVVEFDEGDLDCCF